MKSNAPWSVKGIERDARETAKEAARREGMTVGEWLNQIIYTASDPETSNGEIEGIKISDLVNAIEHLNKRVIGAESKSAVALDDLVRNFGGVVERVQRLERGRPAADAPGADIEERVARLEEKSGDRQRIDALRALEKAVGQVALQFDTAQKSANARMEAAEDALRRLAERVDTAPAGGDSPSAIAHLKDAVDGLSARIARAERIASEAAKMKSEASDGADAEFVERTGSRLRILGDEIKRGGDQIRSLETLVKKLSGQIDAAERRSSEGVQKVSETIADLREKFAAPGPADARGEIEAAVALMTRRTDERIAALEESFEERLAQRVEPAPAAVAPPVPASDAAEGEVAEAVDEPEAADAAEEIADKEEDDADVELAGLADDDAEAEDEPVAKTGIAAFDLEEEAENADDDEDPDDAAFNFDLDRGEVTSTGERDYASEILSEVESAFAGVAAKPRDEAPAPSEPKQDEDAGGLDAILAELEGEQGIDSEAEAEETLAAPAAPLFSTKGTAGGQDDYLRAARRAAREAAEKNAAKETGRRVLTPRQRAVLASKIRRKRLAEHGLSIDDAAQAEETPPAPALTTPAAPEIPEEESRPTLRARVSGALSDIRGRFTKPKEEAAPAPAPKKSIVDDEFAPADAEEAADPDLRASVGKFVAAIRARPITAALGVAILLAVAALFFLVRDLMFGAPQPEPRQSRVETSPANTAEAEPQTAPQLAETTEPEVPAPPVVQPRALYLESVAALKGATTDAETTAAIEQLTQAAALGHPPAQLQLGELFKLGQGVEQDPAQARSWYERAATGGNVLAMHRIGVMAARGQGGATDSQAAVGWFERASNLGLVDSQYNLGAIYHPSADKPAPHQSASKAYYWYSLAARNGDSQAGSLAASLGPSIAPGERRRLDETVEAWQAQTPDPDANEVAPAS